MSGRHRPDLLVILCACLALCIVFLLPLIPPQLIHGLSDLPAWYSHRIAGSQPAPKIVAIAVDEQTLAAYDQRWPLKRSLYARLVRELAGEQAKVIAFDLFFQGQSDDPADDLDFSQALQLSSATTVIGYTFDAKSGAMRFPQQSIARAASLAGLLYAPKDADGLIRRYRAVFRFGDQPMHYSFAVACAAAAVGRPVEEFLTALPLSADDTFRIRYWFRAQRSGGVRLVNLRDILEHRQELKARPGFGPDFLRDSICLVYPSAAINHDLHPTPAGQLDGGLIQLNALLNLAAGRTIVDAGWLTFFLALLCFLLAYAVIVVLDVSQLRWLIVGLSCMLAIVFLFAYWAQVAANAAGLSFDYGRVAVSVLLFFFFSWALRYAVFLTRLAAIKNKATIDPLRRLFTLRYFFYRLDLEAQKAFFGRSLCLVCVDFNGLPGELKELDLDQTRSLWGKIAAVLENEGGYWGIYSPEQVVGAVQLPAAHLDAALGRIQAALQALLRERGLGIGARAASCLIKKEYPAEQLAEIAFSLLRSRQGVCLRLSEADFSGSLLTAYADAAGSRPFLDSLAEDIEEKNREVLSLYGQLKKEYARTKDAFFQIIESLVNALEARDPYTQGHSQRVADYSRRLAAELGWSRDEQEKLHRAALLHDIGKIGIPDSILHKQGKLSDEEFDFIKKHEVIAVNILKPLKDFEDILPWVYHHERWDGKGYPHGLGNTAIPQASRILSIADVYDALTTGRDYKKALNPADTLAMLRDAKGSQFDPDLTERFIAMITRQAPQI